MQIIEDEKDTHDETSDGDNLDRGEPELGFTVRASTEQVDDDHDDDADGNPRRVAHPRGRDPVVDQDGRGGQLSRQDDDPVDADADWREMPRDGWTISEMAQFETRQFKSDR